LGTGGIKRFFFSKKSQVGEEASFDPPVGGLLLSFFSTKKRIEERVRTPTLPKVELEPGLGKKQPLFNPILL
jgi:hypothetical protein